MKSIRRILVFVLVGLAVSSLFGFNEGWRITNAQKCHSTWGYGTVDSYYNYAFCYSGGPILDSLSVTQWQVIEYEQGPTYHLAPFVGDFGVTEGNGTFTIRTAWLNPEFHNTPYIRESIRANSGRWLEDKLLDASGTLLWHKQYNYNPDGSIHSIRLTDYEAGPAVGEWLTELNYDAMGRKINEYSYQWVNSAWVPRNRHLYHYVDGATVPANFRIIEQAPYICRKWDHDGVEVFSDDQVDVIYHNYYSGGNWIFDYYWLYYYNYIGDELRVHRYRVHASGGGYEDSYGAIFHSSGMRVSDYQSIMYADAYVGNSIRYSWQPIEDTHSDDPCAPAPNPVLSCYPNPFRTGLSVKSEARILSLAVYDLRGRFLTNIAVPSNSSGDRTMSWDAKDSMGKSLAPGIYFIRVVTDQGIATQKVLKAP